MAVQYPKSTHVTLPSVEQWSQNTNILRDPPKSITTRRIDKVGENVDINRLVDESGDRICEGINVYSRGINPMVSVSYDNTSNNAGMSGNPTAYSNRPAARLPFPAFENGSFRPPIRTQRDLLPLSRQPRAWFGTITSPEFIDYTKTKQQPNDFRAIKDIVAHAYDVKPNRTTTLEKGIVENYMMTDHINDGHITLNNTTSGKEWNYFSSYTMEHADVQKGALDEVLHADAMANRGMAMTATVEGYAFNPNKYISDDHTLIETYTNPSSNKVAGLDSADLSFQTGKFITDVNQIEQVSNKSRTTAQNLDEMSIQSDRYIHDVNQIARNTNVSQVTVAGLDEISIQSGRYIQDVNQIARNSNVSANVQVKTLDELYDNGRVSTKTDLIHYSASAGKTPTVTFLNEIAQPELEARNPLVSVTAQRTQTDVSKRVDHITDHKLIRHTPITHASTNITKIDDFNNIQTNMASRTVHLDPLLKKGGFGNVGNKPSFERSVVHTAQERESDKDRIRNRMNDMQFNRYSH
jgi:hypothetical protein